MNPLNFMNKFLTLLTYFSLFDVPLAALKKELIIPSNLLIKARGIKVPVHVNINKGPTIKVGSNNVYKTLINPI